MTILNNISIAIGLAGLMTMTGVNAQDALALAKRYNCTACHSVDKKVVGPAFKDVAKKYKGDAAAVEKLTTVMHKGSQGKWGQIPMPPTANLKDEDAKALAGWIMSL